eukprot:TRINITY_DN8143_c0_g1_i1.p1 TRINITY_DN8143_c0_g1~~TRINITY_DN8143_c0_g1_i1.p1  ORF type:complete len:143 (-),score=18.89 TRINITY_DN8143_c0_g1_i1:28-456(-)
MDIVLPKKNSVIMIFCNTVQSCRYVDHLLTENGLKCIGYHGAILPKKRAENFEAFINGDKNILVCTDLAARGLDTTRVDLVVLFDFPPNIVDYLHRIGRTARAGNKGKVISLYTKHEEPLVNKIQEAIKKGESLDTIGKHST